MLSKFTVLCGTLAVLSGLVLANQYNDTLLLTNYDLNGDGSLDFSEFTHLIRSLFLNRMTSPANRHYFTTDRMKKLFEQADLRSDRQIDATEFNKFWRHCLKPLVKPYPLLVVINAQRDFLSPNGSLYINNTERLVPVVNQLSASGHFAQRFFVRDYHPDNHVSFAAFKTNWLTLDEDYKANYTADNRIRFDEDHQISWRPHCVQGTPGVDFAEGLEIHKYDDLSPSRVFSKGTDIEVDALSALRDLNGTPLPLFYELEEIRKNHGNFILVLTGVALEYDIIQTALDAVSTNWPVIVVEEAIGSFEPLHSESIQQVKLILRKNNIALLPLSQAIEVIRSQVRSIEHLFTLANGFYKRYAHNQLKSYYFV